MRSQVRLGFLRQLLLIVAIALLPLLLLHGVTIQQNQVLAEREAEQALKVHASAIAGEASDTMERARRMVAYIAARPEVLSRDWTRCSDVITGLNEVDPAFVTILVLDAAGQPLCSSRPAEPGLPKSYADRVWFQQALKSDGVEVGGPRIGSLVRRPILPVTATVRGSKDAAVRAVVVLSLDLIKLSQRWGEKRQLKGLQLSVLDANGIVLARYPDPAAWIGQRQDVPASAAAAANAHSRTGRADEGLASEQAQVAGESWSVWVSQPSAPMFLLAQQERLQALALTVVVAIAALVLALMQAGRLSASLSDLARTAIDATCGTGKMRANENVQPMFRDVAQALNTMLDTRDLAHKRVERLASINAALSQTNRAIVRYCGSAQLFNELCRICVEAGHATGAAIVLCEEDASFRPVAALGLGWSAVLRSVSGQPAEADSELALLERAVREGQPCHSNHQPCRIEDRPGEFGSLAVLPFRQEGVVIGALMVAMEETNFFDTELMEALEEMTADLSFALDLGLREAARLAAERSVALSRDRLRTAINAMPVAILISIAETGEVLEVNEAICKRYGICREDIIGRHYTEIPVKLGTPEWVELFERVRAGEQVRNMEIAVTPTDRPPANILLNGELIDFDGRMCMLTASVDITERKLAERELARREQQLSSVVEHATDAIITIDASLHITVFNLAASRMFGIAGQQATGMSAAEFFEAKICGAQREAFTTFLLAEEDFRGTAFLQHVCGVMADGREFPIEATLMRVDDPSGEGPLRIAVLSDVTATLLAEQARQARAAAEVANDAKTQFLTRMSHELRTPLNAVLGFAQLLEAQQPAQHHTRHILTAGRHLLELINDMLDISRIEAGKLRLELVPVDVFELIEDSTSLVRAMAKTHQIQLRGPGPASAGGCVMADPQRLRQVIVNLLSNAIKYNREHGGVDIRVIEQGETLAIEIEDQGFGMSREQLAHLFEPFNRLGRDRTRIEGTGIGMALTQQLVGLMEGTLEVESEPNVGTRVRVTLPATAQEPVRNLPRPTGTDTAAHAAAAAPSGQVLYIEDNLVNVLLLQEFFRRWPDVHLAIAENGEEGIRLAKALNPDLILLDMQLPDMDGVDVLEAFKREPAGLNRRTVALSASAMQVDVERALAAGAADYWTKPLDFTRFEVAVAEFMSRDRQA